MTYDALVRLTEGSDPKGNTYRFEYADADGAEKGAVRPTKIDIRARLPNCLPGFPKLSDAQRRGGV